MTKNNRGKNTQIIVRQQTSMLSRVFTDLAKRRATSSALRRTFAQAQSTGGASVPVKQTVEEAMRKSEGTPVYLRPYDKNKYEVPSTKLKISSGYALIDVEPMPRAKIMKLCYNILEKLKEVPEKAMYRIYTEEKIKYIMKLTDETEDIKALEEAIGHESVEMFIQGLQKEYQMVDLMKVTKPWEPRALKEPELFVYAKKRRDELKHMKYDRPEREKAQFVSSQPAKQIEKQTAFFASISLSLSRSLSCA
eukprot:TRINITY_DN4984_c0_g1_i11.p1 TRINITY_DN4984_c0_g1~~TRINITY_DN4984_c0_g1_i11.p1  ORF type:complete len:250 (+),score=86.86 TRINITY_DN4984_c0_g1_i11:94-843(+)